MTSPTDEVSEALPAVFGHVKCVVWDLDDTLWDGVALESASGRPPPPRAWVLEAVDALAERGVLSSVASRTAPSVLEALRADRELARRFVAPQVGWQDKSESLRRLATELGIGVDSLLLVDDSAYERAEVAAMLPGVLTLEPTAVPALVAGVAPAATPEAVARVGRYREELERVRAGREFGGSREDFLRSCGMRLTVGAATAGELARCAELAVRTHRLNASGLTPHAGALATATERGALLLVAELEDVFGGYGLIGAALVDPAPEAWRAELLALSCRVAGRGVSQGFLRWLMGRARAAGAPEFRVDFRSTSANLELRLLFRQMGLRLADGARSAEPPVTLARSLRRPLPGYPAWLRVTERGAGGAEAEGGPGRGGG
ncbi:HAD-IIIC family phosphatase [Streptomyces sp. AJS327]|uniref:HAD-IIIC family phosphatase n=1 Tax=Streptomyces sp. AJS327 TaxID=2545265 RepID=UPI0015DE90DD|nr:HAD-IIIC family phosphatase [Streptomyces sp. AJS327]MBA0050620.1 HAD-IIIC family phosphatase [Streptomyces sp. AJS327]